MSRFAEARLKRARNIYLLADLRRTAAMRVVVSIICIARILAVSKFRDILLPLYPKEKNPGVAGRSRSSLSISCSVFGIVRSASFPEEQIPMLTTLPELLVFIAILMLIAVETANNDSNFLVIVFIVGHLWKRCIRQIRPDHRAFLRRSRLANLYLLLIHFGCPEI